MNRILATALALLMGLTLTTASATAEAKEAGKTATVVFATNLHCDNCKKKIESNIAYEKGVRDLKVDVANKTVSVTYRTDKTSSEALRQAISKLGYTCLIKEEKPSPAGGEKQ